ncbi:MAG: CAP domain-containing protein [Armatimonadetes bacterium]|nr:CAP domain-containing protein [Armatimonadota bacterium]
MRSRRFLAIGFLTLATVLSQANSSPLSRVGLAISEASPNAKMAVFNDQVLVLTNKERAAAGLKPLVTDETLNKAAYWKAVDLSTAPVFDHKDSLGRPPKDRIESFGYLDWARLSENIAGGYFTPEEVVAAWMKSPGHRANIMDPKVKEIGLAFYYDPSSRHGYYWVQNFARRQS